MMDNLYFAKDPRCIWPKKKLSVRFYMLRCGARRAQSPRRRRHRPLPCPTCNRLHCCDHWATESGTGKSAGTGVEGVLPVPCSGLHRRQQQQQQQRAASATQGEWSVAGGEEQYRADSTETTTRRRNGLNFTDSRNSNTRTRERSSATGARGAPSG